MPYIPVEEWNRKTFKQQVKLYEAMRERVFKETGFDIATERKPPNWVPTALSSSATLGGAAPAAVPQPSTRVARSSAQALESAAPPLRAAKRLHTNVSMARPTFASCSSPGRHPPLPSCLAT